MLSNKTLTKENNQMTLAVMTPNQEAMARIFTKDGVVIDAQSVHLVRNANKEDSLLSIREKLSKLPDGEYEFSIIDNGLPIDFPGIINPVDVVKSGNSLTAKNPNERTTVPDVRDIAGFSMKLFEAKDGLPRTVVSLKRTDFETAKVGANLLIDALGPISPLPTAQDRPPTPAQQLPPEQYPGSEAPPWMSENKQPDVIAKKRDDMRIAAVGLLTGVVVKLTTGKSGLAALLALAGSGYEYHRQSKDK